MEQEPKEHKVFDVYTNSAKISSNAYDFIFDFGLESPQEDGGRETVQLLRLRMSPQHAKSLSFLISKVIKDYEAEVGEISLPDDLQKRLTVKRPDKENQNAND